MKRVFGVAVLPLLIALNHVWCWWMLREARKYWADRGIKRREALQEGYITEWQKRFFAFDYYGIRGIVRKAAGEIL
jgi:hypothetical protein